MAKEIPVEQLSKVNLKLDKGIVVVYGSEEYLHKNFFLKLKKEFGSYQLHHAEDTDLDKLVSLLGEKTLFSKGGKSVHILWQAEKFLSKLRKKQKEKLARLLRRDITNLVVFSITSDLKKSDWSKEPYKTLAEVAVAILTAKSLSPQKVALLVKKKFEKEGIKIADEAVQYLLEALPDLTALKNETEKLIAYAKDKGVLTLEEVKNLVEGNPKYTPFDLQKAFFDGDLQRSLKIFEALLEGLTTYEQTPLALQLEGLLLSTANKLLIAYERVNRGENLKSFARELGLYYPFQVKNFENWLQTWDEKRLVNLLKELYKFDTDVKLKFLPAADSFKRFLVKVLG